MSRFRCAALLLSLILSATASAQTQPATATTPLEPGIPVERTLAAGQSHNYTINLDENQFLQLVVDQRGVDVIVRVFSPSGKRLAEYDSPNGDSGPENVSFVSTSAGTYRVEVAVLDQSADLKPGRYEIRVTELRKATEQELEAGKNEDKLKPRGRALVTEALQFLPNIQRLETRAGFEIKMAQMLWDSDEKRARQLFAECAGNIKEFIAGIDEDEHLNEDVQAAHQLRQEMVDALTQRDPEMALEFLHATRLGGLSANAAEEIRQEKQLELTLVSRLASKDPQRGLEMAEASLKSGGSTGLLQVLYELKSKDANAAAQLAHDIIAKLENERLLSNPDAGYLASSFLPFAATASGRRTGDGNNSAAIEVIAEDELREFVEKIMSEVLSFSAPNNNIYTPERDVAQNLINALNQLSTMRPQLLAPDKKAVLDQKLAEVRSGAQQQNPWLKYQALVNEGTPDSALESINQAPAEMRDTLYQQLSSRLIQSGDNQRAEQIAANISNPVQRQQALREINRQAAYVAIRKGRIAEALRLLRDFRPADERAQLIGQLITQMPAGLKRAVAVDYLDQVRAMLDPSAKAPNQSQMFALLQLARVYSKYDTNRAFEIVDPLIDQFNDLSTAALTLNGFGENYCRDGELVMTNGNSLAQVANQMATSLAGLGRVNFERAKGLADRLRPTEVRVNTYIVIAQTALQDTRGGVIDF